MKTKKGFVGFIVVLILAICCCCMFSCIGMLSVLRGVTRNDPSRDLNVYLNR